jgi:hypothetical protein
MKLLYYFFNSKKPKQDSKLEINHSSFKLPILVHLRARGSVPVGPARGLIPVLISRSRLKSASPLERTLAGSTDVYVRAIPQQNRLSNERRHAERISSLISQTFVCRSWHRLNGCRSVTGSVPQLLWMSTELLIVARVYHKEGVMSILRKAYCELFCSAR